MVYIHALSGMLSTVCVKFTPYAQNYAPATQASAYASSGRADMSRQIPC